MTAKKTAAQKKADEVAALMGDDIAQESAQTPPPEVQKDPDPEPTVLDLPEAEAVVQTPPPEAQTAPDSQPTELEPTEAAAEKAPEKSVEKGSIAPIPTDAKPDVKGPNEDPEDDEEDADIIAASTSKTLHVLSKTMHTKDKDGNDVKFLASSKPQDLGEYGDLAVKAGLAKVHK